MVLVLSAVAAIALHLAAAPPSAPVARVPAQNYVSSDDFPNGLDRSAARPVVVTLTVGPDGRVSTCLVRTSSGSASLDSTTCRLLRSRPRFEPARDGAGAATVGTLVATVDWPLVLTGSSQAPQTAVGQAVPLVPWESVTRMRARNGQLAACEWTRRRSSPSPASSNACQNNGLATMALGIAAENKVDFNAAEIIVTMRLSTGTPDPLPEAPNALADIAAELAVGADGRLAGCRYVRERVLTAAARPACETFFRGPFVPAVGPDGRPTASNARVELRIEAR